MNTTPSLHYEVPGLRVVDSWMQLIDRLIVCRLKEFHFSRDISKAKEALNARAQAEELAEAATLYLAECVDGHREPRVHKHLRFHQHMVDKMEAGSLGVVISELTACHAQYWETQGRIMSLRKDMVDGADFDYIYYSLHEEQLVCDQANQRRSELIVMGDQMLRDMLRRPRTHGAEVSCSVDGCPEWATGFVDGGRTPICERHGREAGKTL